MRSRPRRFSSTSGSTGSRSGRAVMSLVTGGPPLPPPRRRFFAAGRSPAGRSPAGSSVAASASAGAARPPPALAGRFDWARPAPLAPFAEGAGAAPGGAGRVSPICGFLTSARSAASIEGRPSDIRSGSSGWPMDATRWARGRGCGRLPTSLPASPPVALPASSAMASSAMASSSPASPSPASPSLASDPTSGRLRPLPPREPRRRFFGPVRTVGSPRSPSPFAAAAALCKPASAELAAGCVSGDAGAEAGAAAWSLPPASNVVSSMEGVPSDALAPGALAVTSGPTPCGRWLVDRFVDRSADRPSEVDLDEVPLSTDVSAGTESLFGNHAVRPLHEE